MTSSEEALIVVDAEDFGAVADGATDDTAAIQAAISVAEWFGGAVAFPPGVYLVTRELLAARRKKGTR